MAMKLIDATAARNGTSILIDGEAYTVRSNDISKSGKHGASKCRIEALGVFSGKKKIIAVPGSERFEVPLVEKKRAQLLSFDDKNANIMDLESFETMDLPYSEEIKSELASEKQVEYWEVEGRRVVMRVLN